MTTSNPPARHAFLALFTLLTILATASEAFAAEPSPPAELRAEVYSRTAVELFWSRPDVSGLRYEIRRDGKTLTTTDGVSFFDSSLSPGTSYEYRVRAINRDSGRSTASTLRVTTAGAAGDDGPLTPYALVVPEIERIAVYSGTAAELFWQRPSPGSPVARVEVARDNIVLGTTNGTSFFDDSRSTGVDYWYTLVAIAADGRRSDGGASEPGAGGDGLDVIRPDNAVRLLAAVFDAYRGEPWGDIVYALPGFSYTPNISINEEETVICDNGGTVTVRLFSVPAGRSSSQFGFDFAFDDCQDGDTLFDGQVDNFGGRWGGAYVRSSGIIVTRPTGTIRYSSTVFDEPAARARSTSGPVDFERSAPDGSSVLLEANNGDDRSARLTVIDTSGERTSFDQQWSVWQENLRID